MNEILYFILFIIIINFFFKKFKLLLNNTGHKHQSYNQISQVPLTGGIFILFSIFIKHYYFDNYIIIFLSIFFLVGLLGDINFLKSATNRFFIQLILIILLVVMLEIRIIDIRIELINSLLQNEFFNIFFVSFCFLVLINGSNFIDGNNGNVLGYYIITLLSLLFIIKSNNINYEGDVISKLFIILFILYFFNVFNQFYLGDGGVYVISLLVGIISIDFVNKNSNISPYYIVSLLWYPAFEILFSLLRKILKKKSPLKPDIFHLHQLFFNFFKKKIFKNKVFLNSLTGFVINILNFIIISFASLFVYSTKIQILIIIFAITVYLLIYRILLKFKYNSEK